MPNFNLTTEQAQALSMLVLSWRRHDVPARYLAGAPRTDPRSAEELEEENAMKTGPGRWFVDTGCFVCHSVSALGVRSPAQIGPDLSTAVEDAQSRFGMTMDDFLDNPTGTMSVVLSRQIILTPEQKQVAVREAARGVRRAPASACGRAVTSTESLGGISMGRSIRFTWTGGVAVVVLAMVASQCTPSAPQRRTGGAVQSDAAVAALKTFVAPGDLDEYYMFASGGHSGQIYVYGLPSMRHLSTIPVFTPYPATGYGFDDDTKKMLGDLTWGDAHHPALSETKGDYDGRWLFINEMNGRIARIDLRDFKTKQILGPVPNLHGNHGSSFVTPNSEYAMMATRFSRPVPNRAVGIDKYATEYKGIVAGVKIDPSQRRDVARLGDPDAALRLRHRRRRQAGLRRLDVLHLVQLASAPPASSK